MTVYGRNGQDGQLSVIAETAGNHLDKNSSEGLHQPDEGVLL